MLALILAVAMQGAPSGELRVTVNVVRPACVLVGEAGELSWSESRRPGPDAVHCTRTSSEGLPPPRLAKVTRTIEGSERQAVQVDY